MALGLSLREQQQGAEPALLLLFSAQHTAEEQLLGQSCLDPFPLGLISLSRAPAQGNGKMLTKAAQHSLLSTEPGLAKPQHLGKLSFARKQD